MAFILDEKKTTRWPVTIQTPNDGARKEQKFIAEFAYVKQSRINEIREQFSKYVTAVQESKPNKSGLTDVSVADEVLVGWSEIEDEEGNELPYNLTNKKKLLEHAMMASAVIEAYFTSLTEAKEKN